MRRISLATLLVFFVSVSLFVGLNLWPAKASITCELKSPKVESSSVDFPMCSVVLRLVEDRHSAETEPAWMGDDADYKYQPVAYELECGWPWPGGTYSEDIRVDKSYSSLGRAFWATSARGTMPLTGA